MISKRHILDRKHVCWRSGCQDKSINATKRPKETLRRDMSHVCPDHPRSASFSKVAISGGV